MIVKWKKLTENAIIPKYAHKGDSGFDLCSIEDVELLSGDQAIIKTGLAVEIPKGYEMQIRPRSGLAAKQNITIANSPGTIDSGYRGEIRIILYKHRDTISEILTKFIIKKGDRIAQGIIAKVYHPEFVVVEELDDSERGTNGLGSTGQ